MAFREKDYLKRQLAELARVLARALGFKEAGKPVEARAALEAGAVGALGISFATLGAVDVETARGLLRTREGAEGYARLLECEAAIEEDLGDATRAEALRARAGALRGPAT
jgi:hypothetical protein